MRIVPNLKEIDKCPNCESRGLISNHNQFGRLYKLCPVCTEELYENEFTIDMEEARDHAFNVGKAPDDIDDSLMDIEYEVANLPRYATNKDELEYLERIRNIFDELISVIRRMK